jgi:ABC-type glutathione transport system ATPase component
VINRGSDIYVRQAISASVGPALWRKSRAALSGKTSASNSAAERANSSCALDGVSLSAEHGTLTALVGPGRRGQNHAHSPHRRAAHAGQQGQLHVLDVDVAARSAAGATRIGYMPQRFGLYEDLSVQENLEPLRRFARRHRRRATQRYIPQLMDMTGLGPFTGAAGRAAVGRNEAETRTGLHAGALAGTAAAGRADRWRRSAVAPGVVGDHPCISCMSRA